jgi:glutaconate CoA-transferase subunit B
MPQSQRTFVERVDFITSFGFGDGGDHRERLGIRTLGPAMVVTDLCIMRPDPATRELVVVSLHEGVTREQVEKNTGWPVRFADGDAQTAPPTKTELATLRDLQARTALAHGKPAS